MSEADYYAPGSYYDQSAPWNQEDVPEKDFDVTCSQSLSRTAVVTTNNYIPGASGVDYEPDGEGGYYASGWQDEDDTSDTNWSQEYDESGHYTPLQLIQLFKVEMEKQLKECGETVTIGRKAQLKHYIEECEGWNEDETEIFGS